MSGDSHITILGETIKVSNDYRDIYSIKFLEENPSSLSDLRCVKIMIFKASPRGARCQPSLAR